MVNHNSQGFMNGECIVHDGYPDGYMATPLMVKKSFEALMIEILN